MTFDVKFNDSGRKAENPSNPKYPEGMDASVAQPGQKSCTRRLPYPAPRCGTYSVVCRVCHFSCIITVAGRADDPRSITLPCKALVH
jgi:hypothetical protein